MLAFAVAAYVNIHAIDEHLYINLYVIESVKKIYLATMKNDKHEQWTRILYFPCSYRVTKSAWKKHLN